MTNPTDEQIEAAVYHAMEWSIENETDPVIKAGKVETLELTRNDSPENRADALKTIRIFLSALSSS